MKAWDISDSEGSEGGCVDQVRALIMVAMT